jgi:nitroreductase
LNVADAVEARFSTRAYLEKTPDAQTVRRILERALRAPSGGNLQPWRIHALTGAPLKALINEVAQSAAAGRPEAPEYRVYPDNLWEPYRTRRFRNGEELYAALQIPREDRSARLAQFARNFSFFGAPVGLIFTLDSRVGPPQWSDMGMLMQNVMLLAVEEGLDTCAQEAWSMYPATLRRRLELPENEMVFSGMALGFRDDAAAVNQWRSTRAAFEEVVTMKGF